MKRKRQRSNSRSFYSVNEKVANKDFAFTRDKIQEVFENKAKFNVKTNFGKIFIKDSIPFAHFAKIGLILMLCFASFMMNFHLHRQSVKYDNKKVAKEYDENQDTKKAHNDNLGIVKKNLIGEPKEIDLESA